MPAQSPVNTIEGAAEGPYFKGMLVGSWSGPFPRAAPSLAVPRSFPGFLISSH